MRIAFIGGGIMAEAIISGIIESRIAIPEEIRVGEPIEARRRYLEDTYALSAYSNNKTALDAAALTILAVKPQSLSYVLPTLKGTLDENNVVISIVAGGSMQMLADGLNHQAIIRVMPNTPAQIRAGMSVWTSSSSVSEDKRSTTKRILGTLGEEFYTDDENFIDMATALSASGPAYVLLFIESLIDAGVYLGMARDAARELTLQTILGTTQLVKETGRHPADLKDMVTSPGGTTIEALRAFENGGFRATIFSAVKAAHQKSQELGG